MQKQQQQGVNIATNIQVQKTLELNEKLLVEWRKLQNAEPRGDAEFQKWFRRCDQLKATLNKTLTELARLADEQKKAEMAAAAAMAAPPPPMQMFPYPPQPYMYYSSQPMMYQPYPPTTYMPASSSSSGPMNYNGYLPPSSSGGF